MLRFASGFFPTRPRGARVLGVSRRPTLRAVASSSRLLPTGPAKDSHLQSSAHARHTFRRQAQAAAQCPSRVRSEVRAGKALVMTAANISGERFRPPGEVMVF